MRPSIVVVILVAVLSAVAPTARADCEVYSITLQGRVAGYDFERTGLLRWLDWSLSGDENLNFEFSIWSPGTRGKQNGDLVLTTHSKLFQTKDAGRTAAIRPTGKDEFEVLPYNHDLNYFVHGNAPVKIREGSMRLHIVRSERGVVSGKIRFVGLLADGEESEYTATFRGIDPSDDGSDMPCFRHIN